MTKPKYLMTLYRYLLRINTFHISHYWKHFNNALTRCPKASGNFHGHGIRSFMPALNDDIYHHRVKKQHSGKTPHRAKIFILCSSGGRGLLLTSGYSFSLWPDVLPALKVLFIINCLNLKKKNPSEDQKSSYNFCGIANFSVFILQNLYCQRQRSTSKELCIQDARTQTGR